MLPIFLQTFSSYITRADFIINQDFIARVLCINKENKPLHCKGHCYLSKQLKKQASQEQNAQKNLTIKTGESLFCYPAIFKFPDLQFLPKQVSTFTAISYQFTCIGSIFRPPSI
jgi:hypothetical protein